MANRKKTSKIERIKKQTIDALSPYDDPVVWLTDPPPCPWTKEEIEKYQKKLDSAFGVEKGIVLAWSYDRTYWDEIYMDGWDVYGEPTTKPQKTPILLFKQVTLNDKDRLYISTPRWMLLERIHGSQLEAGWEAEKYEADDTYIGGKKRIRRSTPPRDSYQPLLAPLGTLAKHEHRLDPNAPLAPCCERLWAADKTICYGKYRPPTTDDLIAVKKLRERMDADGLYQRNDAERSQKLLSRASTATKHFMDYAARRRKNAVQEMIMADPKGFMGDVFKNYGITLSAPEIDRALKEGFKAQNDKENV